jgi:hypothetical protein
MSRASLRKFALLAALFWLPMSVFAQFCATHSLAMKIGGHEHPALLTINDMAHDGAHSAGTLTPDSNVLVIDASTFWASVDDYDDGCDQAGLCALASVAAPLSNSTALDFEATSPRATHAMQAFTTRATAPDTPPPRSTL